MICGLVGVLSQNLTDQHRRSFFQNLVFDTVRGEDSTGIAIVKDIFSDKAGMTVDIYKSLGTPSELFRTHPMAKQLSFAGGQIFMGHNRAATQGAVTVQNAHPFEFQNIIGMHNGTVAKWALYKFAGHKAYDVDSQIILNELETRSIKEVWADLDGAATLAWLDKRDKTLNFIRNHERPLWFTPSEDENSMFWSSEPMFARMGAIRSGIKLKDSFEAKVNNHYQFKWNQEQQKIVLEVTPVDPFVAPKPVYSTGYSTGYNQCGYKNTPYTPPRNNVFKGGSRSAKTGFANNFIIEDVVCDDFNNLQGHMEFIGVMPSGKNIVISIPAALRTEKKKHELRSVLKKIMNRSPEDGQYYCAKITKSYRGDDIFQAHWEQCHWVPNHSGRKIYVRDETTGGYKFMTQAEIDQEYKRVQDALRKKEEIDLDFLDDVRPTADYLKTTAPWYEPHLRLSEAAFLGRVHHGCADCRTDIEWKDKDDVLWLDKDTVVCADCKHKPWVETLWMSKMEDK